MFIDPTTAKSFIAAYAAVMQEVHKLTSNEPMPNIKAVISLSREAVTHDPDLLHQAIASLKRNGKDVSPEILRAIESLKLRLWIYLKDTTKHSVFLDAEDNEAYAVIGLSSPIREIIGGTGVSFQAGVVELGGKYVCDGVLTSPVWLGPNYKREFTSMYAELKQAGRFHINRGPQTPSRAS